MFFFLCVPCKHENLKKHDMVKFYEKLCEIFIDYNQSYNSNYVKYVEEKVFKFWLPKK